MKTFENENYYRILQVAVDAGADEIRRAYREALAIYAEESTVTYSLFSEEQRETLLQAIETAFETLIDADKRSAYNQVLVDTGQMDAADGFRPAPRKPAAKSAGVGTSKEKILGEWVQKRADVPEIKQRIEAILSKELLSGPELKNLREAYGIELSEIYAITRISGDTLKRIEANQFEDLPAEIYVRHFLKAYAEILQIDPRKVVDSYLKVMAGNQP